MGTKQIDAVSKMTLDIPDIMKVPMHQPRERMVVSSIPAPSYKPMSLRKQGSRWDLLRGCFRTSPRKQREKIELLESSKEIKLTVRGQWIQFPGSETESLAVTVVRAVTHSTGHIVWYPLLRYVANLKNSEYMSIKWSDYFSREPVGEEQLCGRCVDAS